MKKFKLAVVVIALLALLSTQAAWAAPQGSGGLIHVVQRGENLFRISLRYGTTVQAIAAANGLANPNHIFVGQRLFIPRGGHPGGHPGGNVYIVRHGDTLSGIARHFGVSLHALMSVNHIVNPNRIFAGQRLIIPAGGPGPLPPPDGGTFYRVQRGDTLFSIALRFGVSVWAIVHVNGLSNPNVIYAGQVLRIPTF